MRQCPSCRKTFASDLDAELKEDTAELITLCKQLEATVEAGDFRKAAKLKYQVAELNEKVGLEWVSEFLNRVTPKIDEQRRKAREARKAISQ